MIQKHVHVTDVNEAGAFAVNTFIRAVRGAQRPLSELPHVLHIGSGRPTVGILIGKNVSPAGRTTVEIIQPARGPRGPYVKNITADPAAVYPNAAPVPEESRFLGALAQYRHNPNDYYWDMANRALADWMQAVEATPPPRFGIPPSEVPPTP